MKKVIGLFAAVLLVLSAVAGAAFAEEEQDGAVLFGAVAPPAMVAPPATVAPPVTVAPPAAVKTVSVVIPADCPVTVQYAAKLLVKYLQPLSHGDVTVIREGEKVNGSVIHLGQTAAAQSVAADMTDGSYVIRSHDGITEINGGGTHGTLNGVFRFLRDVCGYHCYTKDLGMRTEQTELFIPEDLNIDYQSFFQYTDTDWVSPRDPLYSMVNGLNGSTYRTLKPEQGGNVGYISGLCHTLTSQFCSKEKYFEEHPEYFALIDGERSDTQLCLSNEEVYKIVLQEVMEMIEEKHDPSLPLQILSLTQADNFGYCRCESCAAIDEENGSPAGSIITFVNKIAKEVKAAGYDNIGIDTFAYQYSRKAPSKVVPEDNVIIRLCTIECCFVHPLDDETCEQNVELMKDLSDWSKITRRMSVWDYTTNYAYTMGIFPDFNILQRNMQIFYENHIMGVYAEGAYYMDKCDVEFGELRSYLLSRLMIDPYCDLEAETLGFCRAYYGEGGEYIAEFLRQICDYAARKHSGIYKKMSETFTISEGEAQELDTLWVQAEGATEDEDCLSHLKRSKVSWRYVKSSLGLCEFAGKKKFEENKTLLKDIKAFGVTMQCEAGDMSRLSPSYYMTGAEDWFRDMSSNVVAYAVIISELIAAIAALIYVLRSKNKKAMLGVLFLLLAEVCLLLSGTLYIPWSHMMVFGILAGFTILCSAFGSGCIGFCFSGSGKKAAAYGILGAAITAALYWAPIVGLNVILFKGEENGIAMVTSYLLCGLYILISMFVASTKAVVLHQTEKAQGETKAEASV